MADKLKETLESIVTSWKMSSGKPNLLINYNLPGYGVTTSINKLLGNNKNTITGKIAPIQLQKIINESLFKIIVFDDFNTNILSDKNFTKVLNAEKSKKFVFIVNSFKPISIKSPTLKKNTLVTNLIMDATKGEIEVK